MPCSPNDVSINVPDGPSGPAIPGFGVPHALKLPNLNPFPSGFPEDLLDLFDKLQLLIPPGALKSQLNPNFGKDVFDSIMKLLDQFMPFLMLYKFFLPILEIIICIIEVLCALMNPVKLISALNRLFSRCIPAFLNLFPIFALIIMIISLLLLILALIEYIVSQILKLISTVLRNINALQKAFSDGDEDGVLAIAKKLGSLLCMFQNLFVLFAIFNIIIQIIKDILSLASHIPPCDDSDPSDPNGCCTPDVCPSIVKDSYTRITGTFKYLPKVSVITDISLYNTFGNASNFDIRQESWQLFDLKQPEAQQFRNIFDAYDVTFVSPKPIFFPTDATYSKATAVRQAPYTVDLKLFYNPESFPPAAGGIARPGEPRFIIFKDCILTNVPTYNLNEGDGSTTNIHTGVGTLAGGIGYEDFNDPYGNPIQLTGFDDKNNPIPFPATLENFIHTSATVGLTPIINKDDGYTFLNAEYIFKPNIAPLLQKNIITIGCVPSIAMNRTFVNNVFAGDVALKTQLLRSLVSSSEFPSPAAAQDCLNTAIATLRSDMTPRGVANFQATAALCLQKLKDDTNGALGQLIGIGFDPCKSTIGLNPTQQFTSLPITVTVNLNERNGLPLTTGISQTIGDNLAARIKGYPTFGNVSNFTYDGYQSFTANLTSDKPGKGTIMVSFDNQTFCTNTIPDNINLTPTHTLQSIDYSFVYTPVSGVIPGTGEGDTDGQSRRSAGDQSRDGGGSKDGI